MLGKCFPDTFSSLFYGLTLISGKSNASRSSFVKSCCCTDVYFVYAWRNATAGPFTDKMEKRTTIKVCVNIRKTPRKCHNMLYHEFGNYILSKICQKCIPIGGNYFENQWVVYVHIGEGSLLNAAEFNFCITFEYQLSQPSGKHV